MWNVADAGTKSLASKRIQMLLHCIGMARSEGGKTIGQEEYESAIFKSIPAESKSMHLPRTLRE